MTAENLFHFSITSLILILLWLLKKKYTIFSYYIQNIYFEFDFFEKIVIDHFNLYIFGNSFSKVKEMFHKFIFVLVFYVIRTVFTQVSIY